MSVLSQPALAPPEIDPIDPASVVPVSVEWGPWLSSVGIAGISTSQWTVPTGVTQSGAIISGSKTTVYLAPSGIIDGAYVRVTNEITAGSATERRSLRVRVKAL